VLEVDLLSVGGGQCAVLRTPEGRTFLVDAGTSVRRSDGPDLLEGFRRLRRLPAPEAAFLSHANADHYSVLSPDPPRRLYLNEYFGDKGTPDTAIEFLNGLKTRCDVRRLHAGQAVDLDARTRVQVLWPPADKPDNLIVNDTSLVLRVVCDGRSILFPGDLDVQGQAALAATPARVRSDVLVMPHHGLWKKTLPPFLKAVDPKVVLISTGIEPHAPANVAAAAEFYGNLHTRYRCYATSRQGWIHLRLDENLPVETMRP